MIKIVNNGKTRYYFDKYNLARERIDNIGDGLGDSLWYTALFLIATGNRILLKAIKKHQIKLLNGKYRYLRHPEQPRDDASRDSSIMGHIALKQHDNETYQNIKNNLSFRISKKFTWSTAWFWAKEKYNWWVIVSFYHCFTIWFQPSYSIHILCQMIRSSGRNRPVLRWLLLNMRIPKWNYFCRMLLNDEFSEEEKIEIENYRPRIDFIWQRDFDENEHRLMTEEEAEYNCLDKIMLDYMFSL